MNSRERLELTLNHKESDRIPIDLNGTKQTGITLGAYKDLLAFLKIKDNLEIINQVQQLVNVDNKILDTFGIDTVKISANTPSNWKFSRYEDVENYYFKDEWNVTWRMPKSSQRYFDICKHPFAGLTLDEIKIYKWPDSGDKSRFIGLSEKVQKLFKNTDKAIIAEQPSGPGILELATFLMGTEEFYINMLTDKRKAIYILNTITEIYIEMWINYIEEIGKYINVCAIAEDLGYQNGPLISFELYKELVEPNLKKLINSIKSRTKAKVYIHSCGDVTKFIPSLIEIGIDVLNPIQVSAANMGDTAKLKKEYGKYLVFWGASCNPQQTLIFGTKKDVKIEVKRRINDLASDGGFVFAPIHNIQSGVPPENIIAMFETALDFGKY
jgi:uroporphyrinogen decarboxylase